jgi:hypothetical protein
MYEAAIINRKVTPHVVCVKNQFIAKVLSKIKEVVVAKQEPMRHLDSIDYLERIGTDGEICVMANIVKLDFKDKLVARQIWQKTDLLDHDSDCPDCHTLKWSLANL